MHSLYSPTKADFIRAKYQFLSFVAKQKDSEVTSTDDLSKVWNLKHQLPLKVNNNFLLTKSDFLLNEKCNEHR